MDRRVSSRRRIRWPIVVVPDSPLDRAAEMKLRDNLHFIPTRPRFKAVEVLQLPACDLCAIGSHHRLARYDASIEGGGAFLCEEHFWKVGPARLGRGIGQFLYVEGEARRYPARRDRGSTRPPRNA